ncbi:beta-lactamase/transpeptidase-like protein, partial [Cryphonectria parasitica EP155]
MHEPDHLVDLHYTPPVRQANSTTHVDGNTVYRVGSISKIFTALGILKVGIQMDDVVTDYIPEFQGLEATGEASNPAVTVSWDDITIGALASHMSGIGLDLMLDLANIPEVWTSLGFPALASNSTPRCQGLYGLPPCSDSEFFHDFGKHHPVYAPFTTPMYSNLGFVLLGFVLEKVSNMTYSNYVQETILSPLGLVNTTVGTPPISPSQAFIPSEGVEEDWWGVDLGWDTPVGGFYSTPNDLITLGSAILNGSLLGSSGTRKWLKPVSSTSTLGRSMGAPWEILRSTNLTADDRLIELYTKGGDIGDYHSKLCLIPDYDLVVTILTAGSEADFQLSFSILSQLLTILLPAIEQAGKDEVAATGMTSTFTDASSGSSITLSVDDGPGLNISNWIVRGHDVGDLYASSAIAGSGAPVRPRLYPTGLHTEVNDTQAIWAWRVVFDAGTAESAAENDAQFAWPGQSCQTWANMDRFPYGFDSIDDFVF